jgi:drug/metabolite transporter (DMT)-like permease
MTPFTIAALMMIASGSIHALVNAIVKGGRDKSAARALTDGSSAIILLPVLPFVWLTPDDPWLIFLLVIFGAFGSFGHYLLIVAHRLAPATVLAPFIYTQLVWGDVVRLLRVQRCPGCVDHRRSGGRDRLGALSFAS